MSVAAVHRSGLQVISVGINDTVPPRTDLFAASLNLDPRSFGINAEMGLLVDS
jgi:phosphatidylserine/phosphatidylglycerophosphate/cardiolipin synthase-like enzyme